MPISISIPKTFEFARSLERMAADMNASTDALDAARYQFENFSKTQTHTEHMSSQPVIRKLLFNSRSSANTHYVVNEYADGSRSCNCPGWTRRKQTDGRTCKHVQAAERHRIIPEYVGIIQEHGVDISPPRQSMAAPQPSRTAHEQWFPFPTLPAMAAYGYSMRRCVMRDGDVKYRYIRDNDGLMSEDFESINGATSHFFNTRSRTEEAIEARNTAARGTALGPVPSGSTLSYMPLAPDALLDAGFRLAKCVGSTGLTSYCYVKVSNGLCSMRYVSAHEAVQACHRNELSEAIAEAPASAAKQVLGGNFKRRKRAFTRG